MQDPKVASAGSLTETQSPAAAPETTPRGSAPQRWRARLSSIVAHIIQGLALREGNLFLLLAVIIGLVSGLLVVCFRIAIDWTHLWLFGSGLTASPLRTLLVPTLAGLLIGVLVMKVFRGVRGSGVNQTKAAVYIYDGYIPFRTVIGKFLICALAIGTGQSLGPEDPSLQFGAGVASALGRRLKFSREKIRMIAPVGAVAGLAAAFNAPISASIFVLEEVIGQWNAGVLGAIILAAVSSVVVLHIFLGPEPIFRLPTSFRLAHPAELFAYAILGVIGGFSSLLFYRLLAVLRPKLKALPSRTQYFQPAAAGLLVGMIGLAFPQVMGAGYYYIGVAMHGDYVWHILALLAIFKILATTFSFVSGTPGGMFAPTMFVGAMIGGSVGALERHFFPHLAGPVGTYALVGIGVLFAGFLRAPMTSVFMVLEVSGNYSIILPVMVANTIAYLISRRYIDVPLFDLFSRQDGIDLPSMEEQREELALRVEDAMQPVMGPVLNGRQTFADALQAVNGVPEQHFLVSLGSRGWSAITQEMLQWQADEGKGNETLSTLPANTRLPWLHPDQTLDVALRIIGDKPLVPVVSRDNFTKVEGVITLNDILRSYRKQFASPLHTNLAHSHVKK